MVQLQRVLLAGVCLTGLIVGMPAIAQTTTVPGQGPLNVPGAPGNPGISVSPSQIPESQRLQQPTTPPAMAAPALQTPSSQLPSTQTLTPASTLPGAQTLNQNAFVVAPPKRSELLRQGTTDERQLAVYERPLPDYDPTGLQIGSFYLFPSLNLGYGYNSNIYATPSGTSDSIFTIAPTLAVRSNFEADQLNLDLSSANQFFASHDTENSNDYQGTVNGRHYFTNTIVGFARAGAAHLHEPRTSPSASSGTEPTQYDDYTAYAGLAQTGLKLQLQGDVLYEKLKFYSVPIPGVGLASNGFRNRDQVISTVRAGYELSHELVAFVRGAYNTRMYQQLQAGFDRDSHGFAEDVGVDLDLHSVFVAEVFGGALQQSYTDSRFGSVSKPDFGLDAVWNVTPRTSILFDALRSVDETTLLPSPAILTTTLSTGVQYQFLPNLQGRIDYSHSILDYEKTSFEDTMDTVSVGANYFIGRNVVVRPYLAYQTRSSNRVGGDFDQVQGIVSVTLRY